MSQVFNSEFIGGGSSIELELIGDDANRISQREQAQTLIRLQRLLVF